MFLKYFFNIILNNIKDILCLNNLNINNNIHIESRRVPSNAVYIQPIFYWRNSGVSAELTTYDLFAYYSKLF